MTDYEVWMEIAEHMRGSGEIPTSECCAGGGIYGLCASIEDAYHAAVVGIEQEVRMKHALRSKYGHLVDGDRFFWPMGEIPPRIAACEALASDCLRAERVK